MNVRKERLIDTSAAAGALMLGNVKYTPFLLLMNHAGVIMQQEERHLPHPGGKADGEE